MNNFNRGYFKTGFETVADAASVRISDAGSIRHGVLKCPLAKFQGSGTRQEFRAEP